MANIYLGLVHHPIQNKNAQLVTTSVTNLDIHDISRSCRTFGVKNYFIITPLAAQHDLVKRILGHWSENKSLAYNPDRQDALSIAKLSESLEQTIELITKHEGQKPLIVATGANFKEFSGDCYALSEKMSVDKRPILLIFGTGWGLHQNALDMVDYFLSPIYGASSDGYNHLSVRSAVAIYLDRMTSLLKN